jgi:hypothetical protein
MTPNEGFNAGIAKRKTKERLAWALKGAPLRSRDMKLSPIGAVAEARKLRDSVTEKLRKSAIDPEEAVVTVVFAKPDFSIISPKFHTVPVTPSSEREFEMAAAHADEIPIGFLVFVWDKEDHKIFGHARPLIVEDPRSLALNEQAVRVFDKYLRRIVLGEGVN